MRNLSIVIIAVIIVMVLTTGVNAIMFFACECIDDAIVVNLGEEYFGSTVGASCMGKSSCGYNDKYAVWYSYTPQSDETVTISLCGSSFDTTLAVFDSCGGIELACNDDYCALQSELTIDLTAGQTYLIRVAGYNGQMGDYTLTIMETTLADPTINLNMDNLWMYQNLPGETSSNLTVNVSIVDDPLGNSSYSYQWEFVLPSDVGIAPVTVNGGGTNDTFWTFAAPACDELGGLSDSGQAFTVKVTVTGNDYGNTATAKIGFGIILLGDVDNNGVVDMIDRVLVNNFWQLGPTGLLSLRDCDVNCDGVVDATDRNIVNNIFQGKLGQNSVGTPYLSRYKNTDE
jgi:hypothetical protein